MRPSHAVNLSEACEFHHSGFWGNCPLRVGTRRSTRSRVWANSALRVGRQTNPAEAKARTVCHLL